jgi:hypothetical protein
VQTFVLVAAPNFVTHTNSELGLWVTRLASLPPTIWQRSFGDVDQYLGARTASNIDKQRVAAVRKLEALGYSYQGGEWVPASPSVAAGPRSPMTAESDAMHGVLVHPADALEGCLEGSEEEVVLKRIVDAIEAYEAVRWPLGRTQGGKG